MGLVHTLVNLVDIAAGVFTPDAFDESLLVPSPNTDGNRPYAMSMHAALVKSVLKSLGLSMTTDRHDFIFETWEPHFVKEAARGLTPNGRAYFAATQAFEHGDLEGSTKMEVQMCTQQVHAYYARHESPSLLFWDSMVKCPLCKRLINDNWEGTSVFGKTCCREGDCRNKYKAYKARKGVKKAKKGVRTGRKP